MESGMIKVRCEKNPTRLMDAYYIRWNGSIKSLRMIERELNIRGYKFIYNNDKQEITIIDKERNGLGRMDIHLSDYITFYHETTDVYCVREKEWNKENIQ